MRDIASALADIYVVSEQENMDNFFAHVTHDFHVTLYRRQFNKIYSSSAVHFIYAVPWKILSTVLQLFKLVGM